MENGKIIIGEHFEIKSKIQDEKRLILVSLPKGYERTKINYPVIFILNASWEMNFIKNASTVHYLYGSGLNPNMIVVGICDTDYNRDFLPHLGGSDRFLEFIKEELIPFIDQRFRTATFRILYGQSNAGLLTTYALLTQPEIFDAYIASSPMIGWDKEFILEKVKLFNKMKLKSRKYFYFNSGSEDYEQVKESIPYFLENIKLNENQKLAWKFDLLENEGHVPFSSLYKGLKFIFPDWMLSDDKIKQMDFGQLEAYYNGLSERYNIELKIPGSMLFEFAFKFLPEKNFDKVIEILNKYIEIYPYSDSAYMRLGQMYYLKEDYDQAKKFFLKADELNPLSKVAFSKIKLVEKKILESQEK